jgi:S-adenosylmethionine synthetase
MGKDFMFTSESATAGHPDKLCDQISDAIVDRFLQLERTARVRAECAVSGGIVFIATRFSASVEVDLADLARHVIRQNGYTVGEFNADDCTVMTNLHAIDSESIRRVDVAGLDEREVESLVAANQVTAFGFACDQTPELMPLPIVLAHQLAQRLSRIGLEKLLPHVMPDGKTQVGIEYRDGKPHRIHSINLVTAHREDMPVTLAELQESLLDLVVVPQFLGSEIRPDHKTRLLVNPGGRFVTGGPAVHSGLTGRKTAVDTYGEYARQSGSALSGKDPLRIDRAAAYAARHAAKNVVAAGLAAQCEVQLSYSIGQAQPVSVGVETFGTGRIDDTELHKRVSTQFDFRPGAIIKAFDLQRMPATLSAGFYQQLACFGQMGRTDLPVPWEQTDQAGMLQ